MNHKDAAGKGSYSSMYGGGTAQELLGRVQWENSHLTLRELYDVRAMSEMGVGTKGKMK